MTIDKEQLKALAESAQGINWRAGNYYGKSFIPAYQVIADTDEGLCVILEGNKNFRSEAEANCAYAAAANPATVLALLDEIERLESMRAVDAQTIERHQHQITAHIGDVTDLKIERDQLKAENEALRSQVAKLQSEPNSYQSGFDAGRAAEKAHAENWRAEAEGLRKDAARLTWLDESQEVDSVGPTLCCGKHRVSLRKAIDVAMAMEARHG